MSMELSEHRSRRRVVNSILVIPRKLSGYFCPIVQNQINILHGKNWSTHPSASGSKMTASSVNTSPAK